MRTRVLLLITVLLIYVIGERHTILSQSTTAVLEWYSTATQLNGILSSVNQSPYPQSVATDSKGNSFVVGSFRASLFLVDGQVLNSSGGSDAFIAKFSANGSVLWVKHLSSSGTDLGVAVEVDKDDNPVALFQFGNTVTLDSETFSDIQNYPALVVLNVNTNGTVEWYNYVYPAGGTDSLITPISLSTFNRSVTVLASLIGTCITSLGVEVKASGTVDLITLRVNTKRERLKYCTSISPQTHSTLSAAKVLSSRNQVLVVGAFQGSVNFTNGITTAAVSRQDLFLAEYNRTGHYQSLTTLSGTDYIVATSAVVAPNGRIFVTASFNGTLQIMDKTFTAQSNTRDALIIKYFDSDVKAVMHISGPGDEEICDIVVHDDNRVIIAMRFISNVTLFNGAGEGICVVGYRSFDILIAEYNATGALLSYFVFGGLGNDRVTSLSYKNCGRIVVSGHTTLGSLFGGVSKVASILPMYFTAQFNITGLQPVDNQTDLYSYCQAPSPIESFDLLQSSILPDDSAHVELTSSNDVSLPVLTSSNSGTLDESTAFAQSFELQSITEQSDQSEQSNSLVDPGDSYFESTTYTEPTAHNEPTLLPSTLLSDSFVDPGDISDDGPEKCSSDCKGRCIMGECICAVGFYGSNCDLFNCTGVNSCSGHGFCIYPNVCSCYKGYSNERCDSFCPDVHVAIEGQTERYLYVEDQLVITGLVSIPECHASIAFVRNWKLSNKEHTLDLNTYAQNDFLVLPAYFFSNADATFLVQLDLTFGLTTISASTQIRIVTNRPIAFIAFGNHSILLNRMLVLDGSRSIPSYADCPVSFNWLCESLTEPNGCASIELETSQMNQVPITVNGTYKFTLQYTSCGVSDSTFIYVETTSKPAPAPRIVTMFSRRFVSRMVPLTLEAFVEDPTGGSVEYEMFWTITRLEDGTELDGSLFLSRMANTNYLVLNTKLLEPDTAYSARVATISRTKDGEVQENYSSVSFRTAMSIPATGFSVHELDNGEYAFEVGLGDTRDSIQYTVYLVDDAGNKLPVASSSTAYFTAKLPPGNFRLLLAASNGFEEIVLEEQIHVQTNRSAQSLLTEIQEELISNASDAVSNITLLISKLKYITETNSSLVPSVIEVKEQLLGLMNSTLNNAQSPVTAVDRILQVEALTAPPISNSSVAIVLKVLAKLVNKIDSANDARTNEALKSAANSISNVAQPALNKNSTTAALSVDLTVIASVIQSLMAPGQNPVTIETPNVGIVVVKDYASTIPPIVTDQGSVTLPSSLQPILSQATGIRFSAATSVIGLQLFFYYNHYPYLWANTSRMGTSVMTVRVTDQYGQRIVLADLPDPILLALKKEAHENTTKPFTCQYWEEDNGRQTSWDGAGCQYKGENSTFVFCICNHTTTFSAFMEYDKDIYNAVQNYNSVYFTEILVACIVTIPTLMFIVMVIALRNFQPLKSRHIAPAVGLFSLLIDSVLQGIIRNSLLVSQPTERSVFILGSIIMVLANPFSILALFLFLWQQIRHSLWRYLYKSMSSNSQTVHLTKLLTSELAYNVIAVVLYVGLTLYFLLTVILGASGVYSAQTLTIVSAASYGTTSLVVLIGIVMVVLWDLSTVKISPGKTEAKGSKLWQLPSSIWEHFTVRDPLLFRTEGVVIALTLTAAHVAYSVGIVRAVRYDIYSIAVVTTTFDTMYSVLRFFVFGGLISLVALSNAYTRRFDMNKEKKESDDVLLLKLLLNEAFVSLFKQYLTYEMSLENLFCWQDISKINHEIKVEKKPKAELSERYKQLHATYIAADSDKEVNIPGTVKSKFLEVIRKFDEIELEVLIHATDLLYFAILSNLRSSFTRFKSKTEYIKFEKAHQQMQELEHSLRIDHQNPENPDSFR